MREIKFRAWDKKNKKMLQPRAWRFKGWLGVIKTIHMTNTDILGTKTPPDVSPTENLKPSRSLKEFTLMQYTGHKDKNGKEIYEGDIVQYNTGDRFEVKWVRRNASFEYFEIKQKASFLKREQKVKKSDYGITNSLGSHEVEIIGNIYENPELINKEYD